MASATFSSGPASGKPIGSILSCPYQGSWTSAVLFGGGSSLSLGQSLTGLLNSIQGASSAVGVNLIAQIFNQAAGNDCTSDGCIFTTYSGPSYVVPSTSPAIATMLTMNQVSILFYKPEDERLQI